MPISKKLLKQLDDNKIKYEIVKHKTVFTAYDLAQTTKMKLSQVAKTLLVKKDQEFILVSLPAHYNLDLKKLKKLFKAKAVTIVRENAILKNLKIKPGTQTPFGKLYKLASVVDRTLLRTEKALVGAGSFTESLRLKMKDLVKLEEPTVGDVGKKK